MRESRVETWRRIIRGGDKSWVLFEHGTCVILMRPEPDLAAQATEILRERGPVHAASPAGDFTTITLHDYTGRVVTGHHPYVLNYVAPDEVHGGRPVGSRRRPGRGAPSAVGIAKTCKSSTWRIGASE